MRDDAAIPHYRAPDARKKPRSISRGGYPLASTGRRKKRNRSSCARRSRSIRHVTHVEMLISLIKGTPRPDGTGVPFAFYMEIVIVHLSRRYMHALAFMDSRPHADGVDGMRRDGQKPRYSRRRFDREEAGIILRVTTIKMRETVWPRPARHVLSRSRCFFSLTLSTKERTGQRRWRKKTSVPRPNVLFARALIYSSNYDGS